MLLHLTVRSLELPFAILQRELDAFPSHLVLRRNPLPSLTLGWNALPTHTKGPVRVSHVGGALILTYVKWQESSLVRLALDQMNVLEKEFRNRGGLRRRLDVLDIRDGNNDRAVLGFKTQIKDVPGSFASCESHPNHPWPVLVR